MLDYLEWYGMSVTQTALCVFNSCPRICKAPGWWLSEHLGHTLQVHKSHYRLQEPIVELSHLSRLLLAIESGHSSEYVGKTLSQITVSGLFYLFLSACPRR